MTDKFDLTTRGAIEHLTRKTLDMARCLDKTEEYGDCLLWTGATSGPGYPIYRPCRTESGQKFACTYVRRDMFTCLVRELKPGEFLSYQCEEPRCISPDHFKVQTASQLMTAAGRRGALSKTTKGAKLAKFARQSKFAKLDMDKAREIRERPESARKLGPIYGVTKKVILRIRSNLAWKEYGANPWGQLISAANDSSRRRA